MTGHSDAIDLLSAAMVKAWAEFPSVTPEATGRIGQTRTYKYADLASVIETVKPILAKYGLCILQPPSAENQQFDQCSASVSTLLLHESGQWIEGRMDLPVPDGATAQQFGSALTYARRYSEAAMLNLAVEDDDGESASERGSHRTSRQPGATKPPPVPDEQRWQAEPIGKPSDEALSYLKDWLAKHGYDEGTYRRELGNRRHDAKTLIGVIVATFPDLTGGAEEPEGYEPTEEAIHFHGSRQKAIETHDRETAAAAAPSVTKQLAGVK